MVDHRPLFIAIALLAALVYPFEHHNCTHDHHDHPDPLPLYVEEDMSLLNLAKDERMLAQSPNIRIAGNYDNLDSAPASYKYYIQTELGPAVIAYFQGALRVKYPVSGNLVVPHVQTQLCGLNTPNNIFSPGLPVDFVVLFSSSVAANQGWIADSYVCFMASGTNRPMISSTIFNRAYLVDPVGDVLVHEKNTYLLIHEMSHTFGFTASMFPYFIDEYGKTRTGHIKSGNINGVQATVIDVPPLTNNLRSFFGCSSLTGAYLETSGTSGTAGSHFNRRQFVFEYMTSGLLFQQKISEFGLNMLEGSGWYTPDYSYAEPYSFGQGQGCSFLFDTCTDSTFNFDEFCKVNGRGCTWSGRGGGKCMSDTKSAGCKYYTPNQNFDCQNSNGAQFATLPKIEVYGRLSNSRCFDGNLAVAGTNPVKSSYCFNYQCQGSGVNTVLTVVVGRYSISCTEEGYLTIPGYSGQLLCPDPIQYCNNQGVNYCPRNCMGRGVCRNNQCQCYNGFTGRDCGITTKFGVT